MKDELINSIVCMLDGMGVDTEGVADRLYILMKNYSITQMETALALRDDALNEQLYEIGQEDRQIAEWLTDYKKQSEIKHNLQEAVKVSMEQIGELMRENDELKRMLKLAMVAIEKISGHCSGYGCIDCPCKIGCEWRHYDEAMKLIGDE